MDNLRTLFTAGRRDMIDAYVALQELALRAGADYEEAMALARQFFDGNVDIKRAFGAATLLAELYRADVTPPFE